MSLIVVAGPVQFGLVGGEDAKVFPAMGHTIGHADTLIVMGGLPESNMGEASAGDVIPALNLTVAGSIAYCHGAMASNSRSTAMGCSLFWASTVWLRATE